jgi:hypothetical protein
MSAPTTKIAPIIRARVIASLRKITPIAIASTGSIVVITESMLGPTRFSPAYENMKGATVPKSAKVEM